MAELRVDAGNLERESDGWALCFPIVLAQYTVVSCIYCLRVGRWVLFVNVRPPAEFRPVIPRNPAGR